MKPQAPIIATISPCGGGINKDVLAAELAPGQWSGGLNMRFANGFAKRRRGIQSAFNDPAETPYFLCAYITNTDRFLVEAGLDGVYVDDGTTQTEITRFTDGVTIGSITNSGTTATLNTTSAHGRSTGQTVTVFGASPAAYNGTFTITVTDADTFTYTMLSNPGGSATTVGQYSYDVQADFTGDEDDKWTGGVFNGVLILNNPVNGLYYWNGDTTTRLRRVPGLPVGQVFHSVRFFKNYIIGIGPTISGTYQPHIVVWSESAEPGSIPTEWTATSTNDAGDTPQTAEASGRLVDGCALGDTFVLFKDDARFGMDFIGGEFVFRFFRMPGNDGLLARDCVVATPKGHVFLTNGDVKIHNGGEAVSIAEGRIRKDLFSSLDNTFASRSFLVLNPPECEVWVCIPSYGSVSPDIVYAWNWNDDTWGYFEIPAITCATSGLIAAGVDSVAWEEYAGSWSAATTRWLESSYSPNEQRLIVGTATHFGLAETGLFDFGSTVPWNLERIGQSLGDTDTMKVILDSRPQVDGPVGGQFSVYHAATKTADAEPLYPNPVTFTIGTTNWANRFANQGRFLAVKYVGLDDSIVSIRSYDVRFRLMGPH